ncbi:MAG: hypothetical protein ACM3UR_09720 [Bacteroidota bacterium]|nr:hypothetical protein [Ignavibacteria bacterium]MCU7499057.1 hypothetical protein [Ignavibacteria bacterium]MCU7512370.1 hypothetical protein [Ignavibacteria bacterium]MCU7521722.1 hypothetical protein [Ignavibacteria bacterium]MCU7524430.1 hypothetical protein [Ignavibacteria bacterium]
MSLKKSAYNEWSIEKGDYVRKDLSKQDMIYKSRMSPLLRAFISGLVLLAVILAVVLKIQHF